MKYNTTSSHISVHSSVYLPKFQNQLEQVVYYKSESHSWETAIYNLWLSDHPSQN